MNTNPRAIRILCYGDSNTYGATPDDLARQPANIRWTGQLQNILGDCYEIIEQGLGGRTTDLDESENQHRNGRIYLRPLVESANPFDYFVLMLGTNDLKAQFSRNAGNITAALELLITDVRKYARTNTGAAPHILLIGPSNINSHAPDFRPDMWAAVEEIPKLAVLLKEAAPEWKVNLIDARAVTKPGDDGLHFATESHRPLAEAVAKIIQVST